jgi:8-oxo-dGTP pyrophosphatase MutT (NUDIX family)
MRNFPIPDPITGEIHWISRSVAVNGIITVFDDINFDKVERFILMVKRGVGCPDEVGKWCLPCGYLDYNESGEECVNREVFEETGLKTEVGRWELKDANTKPTNPKQNVVFTYKYDSVNWEKKCDWFQGINDEKLKFHERTGGELNEIDEVKWVNLRELDSYDIAFNHKELIEKYTYKPSKLN